MPLRFEKKIYIRQNLLLLLAMKKRHSSIQVKSFPVKIYEAVEYFKVNPFYEYYLSQFMAVRISFLYELNLLH